MDPYVQRALDNAIYEDNRDRERRAEAIRKRPCRIRRSGGDMYLPRTPGTRYSFLIYDWGGDEFIMHLYPNDKTRDFTRNANARVGKLPVWVGRITFK